MIVKCQITCVSYVRVCVCWMHINNISFYVAVRTMKLAPFQFKYRYIAIKNWVFVLIYKEWFNCLDCFAVFVLQYELVHWKNWGTKIIWKCNSVRLQRLNNNSSGLSSRITKKESLGRMRWQPKIIIIIFSFFSTNSSFQTKNFVRRKHFGHFFAKSNYFSPHSHASYECPKSPSHHEPHLMKQTHATSSRYRYPPSSHSRIYGNYYFPELEKIEGNRIHYKSNIVRLVALRMWAEGKQWIMKNCVQVNSIYPMVRWSSLGAIKQKGYNPHSVDH